MTVKWTPPKIENDPAVVGRMMEDGWKIAELAIRWAPKLYGGGAASIHPELVKTPTGPEVHVSWDRKHFYMRFNEMGTIHQRPRPFLRAAAQRFIR